MASIDHSQFIRELYREYPILKERINPNIYGGLLHHEMAAFMQLTRDFITSKDRAMVVKCFQFSDRLLANGDNNVKNAVYVSYLEHFEFGDKRDLWAAELLTTRLRQGWLEIQKYCDSLHGTNVAVRLKDVRPWYDEQSA